eukprot:COSAG06_NODE_1630_length_8867_cov_7.747833_4_plen_75_part_00
MGRTSEEDKWGGEKQQKEDLGREGGGRECFQLSKSHLKCACLSVFNREFHLDSERWLATASRTLAADTAPARAL